MTDNELLQKFWFIWQWTVQKCETRWWGANVDRCTEAENRPSTCHGCKTNWNKYINCT